MHLNDSLKEMTFLRVLQYFENATTFFFRRIHMLPISFPFSYVSYGF